MTERRRRIGSWELVECIRPSMSVELWRAVRVGDGLPQRACFSVVVNPGDAIAEANWNSEREVLESISDRRFPMVLENFPNELAYAMEWVHGTPLESWVANSTGDPESEDTCSLGRALHAGEDLVEGLAALHGLGQIHGALDMRRLIREPDGRLRILGVGSNHERADPHFMAPEQAGVGDVGPETDRWQAAAVIFRLVSGRDLYLGDWADIFRQAIQCGVDEGLESLRQSQPDLADCLSPALRAEGFDVYEDDSAFLNALQQVRMQLSPTENLLQIQIPLVEPEAIQPIDQVQSVHDAWSKFATEDDLADDLELDLPELETESDDLTQDSFLEEEVEEPLVAAPPAFEANESQPEQTQPVVNLRPADLLPLGVGLTAWEELEQSVSVGGEERRSWWVNEPETLVGSTSIDKAAESEPEPEPEGVEPEPEAVERVPEAVEPEPEAVEPEPEAVESEPEAVESAPETLESATEAVEPVLSDIETALDDDISKPSPVESDRLDLSDVNDFVNFIESVSPAAKLDELSDELLDSVQADRGVSHEAEDTKSPLDLSDPPALRFVRMFDGESSEDPTTLLEPSSAPPTDQVEELAASEVEPPSEALSDEELVLSEQADKEVPILLSEQMATGETEELVVTEVAMDSAELVQGGNEQKTDISLFNQVLLGGLDNVDTFFEATGVTTEPEPPKPNILELSAIELQLDDGFFVDDTMVSAHAIVDIVEGAEIIEAVDPISLVVPSDLMDAVDPIELVEVADPITSHEAIEQTSASVPPALKEINLLDLSDLSDLSDLAESEEYADFEEPLELDDSDEETGLTDNLEPPKLEEKASPLEPINLGAPVVPPVIHRPNPPIEADGGAVKADPVVDLPAPIKPIDPPDPKLATAILPVEPIRSRPPPSPAVRYGDDIAWEQAWASRPASESLTKYALIFGFGVVAAWLVFS